MSPLPVRLITSWQRRAVRQAVVCFSIGGTVLTAQAFTAADADTMFEAHIKAFYEEKGGHAWFKESTEGGKVSYWMRAEQLEMVLDAYERTKKPEQMAMFTKLFHGFLADHGKTWEDNDFNDDIMWMVIACTRADLLKPDSEFLKAARENFDLCYARAISPDLGGGLWWKTDHRSKNACVNGPGAIAAFLLHKATGEEHYLAKSKELFAWLRATLFDAATGRISDAINLGGQINRMALTYNQGTFVGAANMLGHHDDARLAAAFTMNELCREGYFPRAGEKGDGGGFNGIGARWIARFMKDRNEQPTFGPWLQKNAEAAWQARRAPDNLTWPRWPQPTPEGVRYSWGSSSAVVVLQVTPPTDPAQRENAP